MVKVVCQCFWGLSYLGVATVSKFTRKTWQLFFCLMPLGSNLLAKKVYTDIWVNDSQDTPEKY